MMSPNALLTRSYSLPALHSLHGPTFTPAQNRAVFGACSRLHGHDYQVEITIAGPIDPVSGMIIRRDDLDQIVEQVLIRPYHGTNLSEHFTHTTGEALTVEFFELLKPHFKDPLRLFRLRVHETAKNVFSVSPLEDGSGDA